jgi:hypothetical protein
MMCAATLGGIPGALVCTRPPNHADGHTYVAAWLPDAHDASEAS